MPYGVNSRRIFGGADYVYSFRTGPRAVGFDVIPPAPQAFQPGGNLIEHLAKRKRFYEELDRNFLAKTAGEMPGRYSSVDVGNNFVSIRFRGKPGRSEIYYPVSGVRQVQNDIYPEGAYIPSWIPINSNHVGFASTTSAFGGVIREPNMNAKLNGLFDSTIPKDLGIGETIIEIVRGNIPSLLSSTRSLLRGVNKGAPIQKVSKNTIMGRRLDSVAKHSKSTPPWLKASGSDFLEIQFGLAPVISQIVGIIEMLFSVTSSLVDESFRRERYSMTYSDSTSIPFPNREGYVQPTGEMAFTGSRSFSHFPKPGGSSGSIRSPYGSSDYAFSVDHKLSLRATLAGRDSGGFGMFSDMIPEQIEKLGLWYPSLSWDILPWSWLVDWVLHIGSAIDRVASYSKSGMTPLDYAYVTTLYRASVHQQIDPGWVVKPKIGSSSEFRVSGDWSSCITTGEYRRSITPFGIGTTLGTLSSTQYAILVALGLARSR